MAAAVVRAAAGVRAMTMAAETARVAAKAAAVRAEVKAAMEKVTVTVILIIT